MSEHAEPTPGEPSHPYEDEARDQDPDQPDHTDADEPGADEDTPSSPGEAGEEAGADQA